MTTYKNLAVSIMHPPAAGRRALSFGADEWARLA